MKLINKIKQWVPYVYVGYKDYKYMSNEGLRLARAALKLAEDNKKGWDLSKIANQGFSEEIERLEAKIARSEMPRDAKGRFVSKQDLMTQQLKREMLDEVIGHYDDIVAASKHEEFGR